MRIIENINTIIRFFGYLLPLFLLLFGRIAIFDYIEKLRIYHAELWQTIIKLVYYGAIVFAALFAVVAIFKLLAFGSKKRYKYCLSQLTIESKIRIAKLAEQDATIEHYFTENSEWLEDDIEHFIDEYSRKISRVSFEEFQQYVHETAVVYFAHRVTQRDKFLEILNRL
ncbi:hypothetical protein R2F61_01660 [Mollicutes bacterium LVI A0078]|nr:hypothetical protein RZE84_01655 [Mollicutes bacterium LVI A0075]WOO91282.1 hypothetical protein R2F61_01660 [Mollicutes bacterium LVI A0078]